MFGMEAGKKPKKVADYSFDLEIELKDPTKFHALREQVQERIHALKGILRRGEEKALFDKSQTLLTGYLAMQKVIDRLNRKSF